MEEPRREEAVGTHPPPCTETLANRNHNCRLSFYGIQNRIKTQPSFARIHVKKGKNLSGLALRSVKS